MARSRDGYEGKHADDGGVSGCLAAKTNRYGGGDIACSRAVLDYLRHPILRSSRGGHIDEIPRRVTAADVRKPSVLFAGALILAVARLSAQQEVIVAIQVHGNTLTADADIVRASGLSEGAAFSDSLLSDAEARLRSSGRFDDVEVLKRYASISDPTQILVLIRVDEGPVRIDLPEIPGPGQKPYRCSPPKVQCDVRAHSRRRGRLRTDLRGTVLDHRIQKYDEACDRPGELGRRQARGCGISKGVFSDDSHPGSGRARSFSAGRIPSSTATRTGSASGAGQNGR